jgi:hypothetical protein
MAMHIGQMAKKVLSLHDALQDVLGSDAGKESAEARVEKYNVVLDLLKECFAKSDFAFEEAIEHLKPLDRIADSGKDSRRLKTDGRFLLTTARRFIELYLSPEDKKAVGFHD